MILENIFKCFLIFSTLKLCRAQCGCSLKGIKVDDFHVDDMVLSKKDILKINGFKAAEDNRWPGGELKYVFSDSYPDNSKGPIRELLKIFEKELGNCVKFIEDKKGIHATVDMGPGCHSYIGYSETDPMKITLPGKCINKRNIKHEFTHLLGFYHEQSRPDRDDFVTIVYENVKNDRCYNFFICKGCKTTTPYDYDSLMQYPSTAFSCNRKETILKKSGTNLLIGSNNNVTPLDAKKIRDHYGC